MKKIILVIIILAVGVALGIYLQKQPKTQALETRVQTDAAQAGADIKEGVQKTGELATNVAAQVKTDAQKVDTAVTNVAGKIK